MGVAVHHLPTTKAQQSWFWCAFTRQRLLIALSRVYDKRASAASVILTIQQLSKRTQPLVTRRCRTQRIAGSAGARAHISRLHANFMRIIPIFGIMFRITQGCYYLYEHLTADKGHDWLPSALIARMKEKRVALGEENKNGREDLQVCLPLVATRFELTLRALRDYVCPVCGVGLRCFELVESFPQISRTGYPRKIACW